MTGERCRCGHHFFERVQRGEDSAFDWVSPDFVQPAGDLQGRDGLRRTAAVLDHNLAHPRIEIHHVVAAGDLVDTHLSLSSESPKPHGSSIKTASP